MYSVCEDNDLRPAYLHNRKHTKATRVHQYYNAPYGVMYIPFNTLRPWENGRHIADNSFKCISNEHVWILFLKVQLTICQFASVGSDNCWTLNRRQAIISTNKTITRHTAQTMMAWSTDAYLRHLASMSLCIFSKLPSWWNNGYGYLVMIIA